MNNFDDDKILSMAYYILENHTTIRATAKEFNTPKSTVHQYLSVRLKNICSPLHKQVRELLEENFNVKHIHGGESTKMKYMKLKSEIDKFDELDCI